MGTIAIGFRVEIKKIFKKIPVENHGDERGLKSERGVTAINGENCAVDVGGSGRCEEDGCGVELAILAIAAFRDHGVSIVLKEFALEGLLGERSLEVARADGVDGDALVAPLASESSGEVDNATLCSMIRSCRSDLVSYETIHGSDVDDSAIASRDHSFLGDFTSHLEGANEVDIDFVEENFVSDVLSGSNSASTGVIDKNVDASELVECSLDSSLNLLSLGDVASNSEGLNTIFLGEVSSYFVDEVLTASQNDDIASLTGKSLSHLDTESCRATGN